MSVILITKHDENIYNIVTTEQEEKIKREIKTIRSRPPTYKSKFRKYRNDYRKCVKAHATMGVAEEVLPDPAHYLKKHSGKPICSNLCYKQQKKDPPFPKREVERVPSFNQWKNRIIKHDPPKDFVLENIKKISNMKPKEPEQRLVVDHTGTSKPLRPGLEPIFIRSTHFGKAPRYLLNIIDLDKKKYLTIKEESGIQKPKCRYITREERAQLLKGLKQNWEELQKQYQGLPILTDTIPKMVRKDRIESNLKQIEKDIQLVERHPYIYVYDDDNFP
ncbi:enkurin [Anoplophora glabripennis]|uniref:enkurin n=1 Tax=Anoplophora glabripennis TaxID=217634 RepID=UPI000C778454|nr:enkurin [Anoplophora glabripennis]